MSMNDPIADMLTRIRNAVRRKFDSVNVPASRPKQAILEVLQREGYIAGWEMIHNEPQNILRIALKYGTRGEPVISRIKRVSKVGCRIYKKVKDIRPILGGLGIQIVSTSKGMLSDREARKLKIGGEVIAEVF